MKIRYFTDTDTALIEFSEGTVAETREISESLYVDLDSRGNLVSMTPAAPTLSSREVLS